MSIRLRRIERDNNYRDSSSGGAVTFSHRTLLWATVLTSLMAACRLFRPIHPNAPPTPKEALPPPQAVSKPTQAAAKPAQQVSARPRAAGGKVSDANIGAMLLASNNTDISYARLVPTRAERADVKEFAQRMLTDHTSVNTVLTGLLSTIDVAPEDNEVSLDLRDESANNRDMMRELSGHAFDSTYMENEVRYHRQFLALIDTAMSPRARNTQLQSLLTNLRPVVAAHRAHAEQVRANVLAKKR